MAQNKEFVPKMLKFYEALSAQGGQKNSGIIRNFVCTKPQPMARIYVASSWRNPYQPEVVAALRKAGHEVYDFRNPKDNPGGFHWADVDEKALRERTAPAGASRQYHSGLFRISRSVAGRETDAWGANRRAP